MNKLLAVFDCDECKFMSIFDCFVPSKPPLHDRVRFAESKTILNTSRAYAFSSVPCLRKLKHWIIKEFFFQTPWDNLTYNGITFYTCTKIGHLDVMRELLTTV